MPRKKLAPADTVEATPVAVETPARLRKPRAKKEAVSKEAVPTQTIAPEPVEALEVTFRAKTTASRTQSKPATGRTQSKGRGSRTSQPAVEPAAQTPAKPAQEQPKQSNRRRPAKTTSTELPIAVVNVEETTLLFDDAGDQLPVVFRTRQVASKTPAAKPSAVASAPAVTTEQTANYEPVDLDGEELPVLEWRSKPSDAPKQRQSAKQVEAVAESTDSTSDTRRSKNRRRKGLREKDITAAGISDHTEDEDSTPAAETAHKQPEPVKYERPAPEPPKVKPLIPTPETAPQIVLRNGVPTIVRNHVVYPPVFYFGSPSDEKRSQTVLEQLSMAAESGIHLHSFLVDLEVDLAQVDASASFAGYMLRQAVARDPEAQIVFRLAFQAPRDWEMRYPKARYRHASGEVAEPSACDDEFWSVAEQCLELFIRKLRLLEQKDHILGVHLERGEWFFSEGSGYDTSPAATTKFRQWAKQRYLNDVVTLRASWFDGSISFDNIQVPEYQPEGGDGERFIRSSRRQRKYVDYHLFLSDSTVQRISELAYAAKAASEGNFLVGVSYGYTFEWSHPASGHLALGKLLRAPEVDFIAGPPSYRTREPGGTAAFPCPVDSFALNGKLYISEEDFKTSLSMGHEPDDFNPVIKTPQALENVHWRGAGVALTHGSGVQWMDLWGNGWLKTHSVWERANQVRSALIKRMEVPLNDPEVAIFIDERALAYLVDSNAFALLVQNVRESVLRAGVSAAFYLLSDLAHREKFPESKLYIFLNAWDVRPDLRAAIKSRLQKDNKVLVWLYSAGLFDAGRDSLERAREVTGIALKPQPFYSKAGTTILNRRHPLSEAFPDRSVIGGTKLEPSYFAIPEDATVLGEYTQTGLPSFVVKEFKDDPAAQWTSVFLGEPLVSPALIRALAQMAGAHVWNFHDDVVHVRAPFCTVHCSGTGPRTITLPDKCSAYNLLTQEWVAFDTTNLRFNAIDGSTHVFLVGPKVEIEHLLNVNPADILRMEVLPEREQNVRHDSSNFDVPIMRLDEWMEGSDQDEVADEWFLRTPKLEEESELPAGQAEESPEQVGRRRRRRKKGRPNGGNSERYGSEEVVTARAEPSGSPIEVAELSMNVLFRKRD